MDEIKDGRANLAFDPYDLLLAGQYAANIRFLQQIAGSYIGENFSLVAAPTDWRLQLGRYQGRPNHRPEDLHGYWIFHKDQNKCWQAADGGRLVYWNQDGRAQGPPEDWELFNFQKVSKADRTVKIASRPGYVGLTGLQFNCSETAAHAAIFIVEFP